jgi:signal transduction histidine kinase
MDPLVEQIFALLTTDTGSLAYHLILAFSILGALQVTLSQSQRSDDRSTRLLSGVRRLSLGLGLMLALQFAAFVVSGLGWQGVIDSSDWLPPVDRAVLLLNIIIIIWLWVVDRPSPSMDSAAFLLGLLAVAAAILGALYWKSQDPKTSLNYSWLDLTSQLVAIGLLGLGLLLLAVRRPVGWVMGEYMLLLLALGHILHLVLPHISGDYSGMVRLSQIAAFSFLFALPGRLTAFQLEEPKPQTQLVEFEAAGLQDRALSNSLFWQSFSKLVAETEPDQVCKAIVATLARISQADLCLLARPIPEEGYVVVDCGFNQSNDQYFDKVAIPSRSLPLFMSSFKMGRTRRIRLQSSTPDLVGLTRALNLSSAGNVLFMPVLARDGRAISSLIFMSPYSGRDWDSSEQGTLSQYAKAFVHLLERSRTMLETQEEIDQTRKMLRLAQEQAQTATVERQKLSDRLAVFQDELKRKEAQTVTLGILTADEVSTQRLISELQTENERLKEAVQATSHAVSQTGEEENEMRLALEEIALLRNEITETEQTIARLRTAQAVPPLSAENLDSSQIMAPSDGVNSEAFISVAEDLRRPLASIVGYTDVLLSESVGILVEAQRKYLERIRVSSERMNRLLDELIQVVAARTGVGSQAVESIDLAEVIHDILLEFETEISQKKIDLHLDLSDQSLRIQSDRQSLVEIFSSLLRNACAITPEGKPVNITSRLEHTEGQQDFVLTQVSDSGVGVEAQQIPFVFSPPREDAPVSGVSSENVNLVGIKALVEGLGGRIWVDSESGQGSVFSVLLPVSMEIPFVASDVEDTP